MPRETAVHHQQHAVALVRQALEEAKVNYHQDELIELNVVTTCK